MAKKKEEVIVIPKPKYETIKVKIIGDTRINVHRLGKKMQQEFEDRDYDKPKPKRGPRDYKQEFLDSLYYIDAKGFEVKPPKTLSKTTRYGFPSSAFKKAMIYAARQFDNLTMASLKGRFFVNQYQPFVEIKGKPQLDKFWRRIGGKGPGTGTPDNGIRATFLVWSAELEIRFLENVISAESVLNLLSVAGFSVGVGEDRPDKSGGTCGMWHIV
jgi:hypothetical protein